MNLSSSIILLLLLILELLVYVDRGIIPGCVTEISTFIAKTLGTGCPSVFLGFLQSAFIGGLSISCPLFAHFTHYVSTAHLIASGLTLWAFSGILAAIAPAKNSYALLLSGRVLSGVGEAALISLVPPLILSKAKGVYVGFWMGCFCAVIPVGTAIGFCYGSLMATTSKGWGLAYLVEALASLPFIALILAFPQYLDCRPAFEEAMSAEEARNQISANSSTERLQPFRTDNCTTSVTCEGENYNMSSSTPIVIHSTDVEEVLRKEKEERERDNPMNKETCSDFSTSQSPATAQFRVTHTPLSLVNLFSVKKTSLSCGEPAMLSSTTTPHTDTLIVSVPEQQPTTFIRHTSSCLSLPTRQQRHQSSLNCRSCPTSPSPLSVSVPNNNNNHISQRNIQKPSELPSFCNTATSSKASVAILDPENRNHNNRTLLPRDSTSTNNTITRSLISPRRHQPGFISEIVDVLKCPSFFWLSVTYAAYSAVVVGFSTFGSAFLQGLDFVKSEAIASLLMGITTGAAGVIGSLAGGGLAALSTKVQDDDCNTLQRQPEQPILSNGTDHRDNQDLPGQPSLCNQQESDGNYSHLNNNVSDTNNNNHRNLQNITSFAISEQQQQQNELNRDRHDDEHNNDSHQSFNRNNNNNTICSGVCPELQMLKNERVIQKQLKLLLRNIIPVIALSIIVLGLGTFSWNLHLFLGMFGVGLGGLFVTQSTINICVMLSVPTSHHSVATALVTVLLHVFGDVPSPIIVGLLKDYLAPACSFVSDEDAKASSVIKSHTSQQKLESNNNNNTVSTAQYTTAAFEELNTKTTLCSEQRFQLRLTILITVLWLIWMLVGVFMARKASSKKWNTVNNAIDDYSNGNTIVVVDCCEDQPLNTILTTTTTSSPH